MQSIQRVLDVFKERGGYDDVINGYHGTLISNLRTDSNYFRAVDTIAGGRFELRAHIYPDFQVVLSHCRHGRDCDQDYGRVQSDEVAGRCVLLPAQSIVRATTATVPAD